MNNKNTDRNNLAIIGATSAGKTTLAVGLYATSTEDFTVSPVGDETSKYLQIRKTSIEEGFWPAAGLAEDNVDIRLRLHASGNQVDIVFREYMGERMERDPNYIREVIGTPKSAMILFNPGMPGLSKPETRNRMLGNLKVIAQHLKDNGCIAVAFVVTASDRLTSDLAAFREDFEAYASEVTNHLTNLGLDWKRFDVTVSGQLDDQNKPKLARGENNTTHEPFLWLLKRIRACKRRRCLRMFAAVVAAFIGVSGALLGGFVVHSRQALAKAEKAFANTTNALNIAYAAHDEATVRTTLKFLTTNSFDKVTTILPSDQTRRNELVKRVNEQSDLWRVRLLGMEFSSNKSKVEINPSGVPLNWFEDFNKRLTLSSPVFGDAVDERDTLTNDWVNSRIELETKCQTGHYRTNIEDERKKLESYEPAKLSECIKKAKELIEDKNRIYIHVSNRIELCDRLGLISARTNAIARYVDSKIGKPEDEKRPDDTEKLRQSVSKDLRNALTTEEFDNLSKIISERNDKACRAWDADHFPRRVTELETALKGTGANPSDPLTNSLAFLSTMTNNYPTISQVEFIKARNIIEGARKKVIEYYENSIAKRWDVNGNKPPEFDCVKIRNAIMTQAAVTDDEYQAFEKDMNARFDTAKEAWKTSQKKLVDDKVESFDNINSVLTILDEYGNFIEDYPQNPYLNDLLGKVDNRLDDFLVKYVADYENDFRGDKRIGSEEYPRARMDRAGQRFYEFRMVCAKFGEKGRLVKTPLLKRPSGKFANLCCNFGKLDDLGNTKFENVFPQTLRIKKVEVKFEPSSLDVDCKSLVLGCTLFSQRWNFQSNAWETISSPVVFSSKELARNSFGGNWTTVRNEVLDVLINPFSVLWFKIDYGDKMGNFWSMNQNGYCSFWLDFRPGSQSPEFSHDIRLVHAGNSDNEGKLSVRITFEGIGEDFQSLRANAQKMTGDRLWRN